MWQCWRCDFQLCQDCAEKRPRTTVPWAALQKPEWFASHWWGEPVFEFVSCLLTHAMARYPPNEARVYMPRADVLRFPSFGLSSDGLACVGPLLFARQMRVGGRHSCTHPTGCAPMVRVPLSVSLWAIFSLFCAYSCVSCARVGVLLRQPTTSTTSEAT